MAVLGTQNEAVFMERVFTTSTTWTPPFGCRAYVTVIGPGGGGGNARHTADHYAYCASGGGGGGCAKSLLVLSSSVTYTVTIGAGGDGVTNAGDGSDGSANSVFSGSDITTMTANLGSGGVYGVAAGTVATQAGGAGGAASGGDIWNVTGGAGGSAACSAFDSGGNHIAAGGGGAAGILGTSYRGGNALNSTAGTDKLSMAGGAGIGGRGGDATCTGTDASAPLNGTAIANGGSADGPGIDVVQAGSAYGYRTGYYQTCWDSSLIKSNCNDAQNKLFHNAGGGAVDATNAAYSTAQTQRQGSGTASIFHGLNGQSGGARQAEKQDYSGPGAGGSGTWSSTGGENNRAMPGLFGGAGGSTNNYYGSYNGGSTGRGASGSYGAGGGGFAGYTSASGYSGRGGDGMVVVTILEIL